MSGFVIVGQGLAGSLLALELLERGQSVTVYDDNEYRSSSRVAAGIFNPITGHRMVKTWLADELFEGAENYYPALERRFNQSFFHQIGLTRVFQNAEQYNDVQGKLIDKSFATYLSHIGESLPEGIKNDLGSTLINRGGWLDVKKFLNAVREYLKEQDAFVNQPYEKSKSDASVVYCEGHRAIYNDLFDWLRFAVTKGEILSIRCNGAPQDHILNKGFWMVPRGDGMFLAGASFARTTDKEPTPKGREFIESKLKNLLDHRYTVVDHIAAVRPTVVDRRPLLGVHPEHKNTFIFNGLGTKGVTLGPYFASHFCDYLLDGKSLMDEVNIDRFLSFYKQ